MISWQVVQEFLNVALHHFERPLSSRDAADYHAEVLTPLCQVLPSPELRTRSPDVLVAQPAGQFRDGPSQLGRREC